MFPVLRFPRSSPLSVNSNFSFFRSLLFVHANLGEGVTHVNISLPELSFYCDYVLEYDPALRRGHFVNVSLLLTEDACIKVRLYRIMPWGEVDPTFLSEQHFLQNGPHIEVKVPQAIEYLLEFRAYYVPPFTGPCYDVCETIRGLKEKRGEPLFVPFRWGLMKCDAM